MDKQTYKIAVVGNRDAILPFRLIVSNLSGHRATRSDQYLAENSVRENFGIIYLTEDIAQAIPEQWLLRPAADTGSDLIPTHRGTTGLGQQRIRDNVEKSSRTGYFMRTNEFGQAIGDALPDFTRGVASY